jgi:hypothetical protein
MASFHLAESLSNETPTMLSPLSASLYRLLQHLGFRQGAHHDAQKSTIVTFPKLKRNTFPSG